MVLLCTGASDGTQSEKSRVRSALIDSRPIIPWRASDRASDYPRGGPAQRPETLSRFVGSRLADGAVFTGHDRETACAGLVLRFDHDDLVVGTLGDEWLLSVGGRRRTRPSAGP